MATASQSSDTAKQESGPETENLNGADHADAEQLWGNLRSIAAYLAIYLETYLDRGKLTFKNFLLGLLLTILTLALIIGSILIGTAFLLYGLSLGVTELSGGRSWLGFSAVGGGLLIVAWALLRYAIGKLKSSSLQHRIKAYAARTETPREQNKAGIFDVEANIPTKRA